MTDSALPNTRILMFQILRIRMQHVDACRSYSFLRMTNESPLLTSPHRPKPHFFS